MEWWSISLARTTACGSFKNGVSRTDYAIDRRSIRLNRQSVVKIDPIPNASAHTPSPLSTQVVRVAESRDHELRGALQARRTGPTAGAPRLVHVHDQHRAQPGADRLRGEDDRDITGQERNSLQNAPLHATYLLERASKTIAAKRSFFCGI